MKKARQGEPWWAFFMFRITICCSAKTFLPGRSVSEAFFEPRLHVGLVKQPRSHVGLVKQPRLHVGLVKKPRLHVGVVQTFAAKN